MYNLNQIYTVFELPEISDKVKEILKTHNISLDLKDFFNLKIQYIGKYLEKFDMFAFCKDQIITDTSFIVGY